MGFANLWSAEIAKYHINNVDKKFSLFNSVLIAYKHQKTRLALEDVKAIICQIFSAIHSAAKWVIIATSKENLKVSK